MARPSENVKPLVTVAPGVELPEPSELDALKSRIAELEKQLAAKVEAAPAAARQYSGPKKLWRVSLEAHIKGFITPSDWFAKEFPALPERQGVDALGKTVTIPATPADPRGLPIEAWDEEEARAIFRKMHGIQGGPVPDVTEYLPDEIEQLPAMRHMPDKRKRRVASEKASVDLTGGLHRSQEQIHRAAQAVAVG